MKISIALLLILAVCPGIAFADANLQAEILAYKRTDAALDNASCTLMMSTMENNPVAVPRESVIEVIIASSYRCFLAVRRETSDQQAMAWPFYMWTVSCLMEQQDYPKTYRKIAYRCEAQ